MTQATEILRLRGTTATRLVASVSAAHFVSHYYILLLPPLFAFVRADYDVSYTKLGLALAAFNGVSAVLQTPAGFLVDRFGARPLLIAGLLLGALAFAVAGLVDSFWVLVAMFGVAGLGNTVYHPADYAILSHHVPPERAAKAFSIHTFAGMLGSAVAPTSLLLMQSYWGWRGAFLGAALLGIAAAALLLVQREEPITLKPLDKTLPETGPQGWRLLLSRPILLNVAFFALLALMNGGLQNYSVVALSALHGMPAAATTTALSAYLALSAIGVLAGGYLASRVSRHGVVAAIGLIAIALVAIALVFNLGDVLLIAAMGAGGLFTGGIMPARDMIVREMTPPGSFGKVFGFVTNGFNLGGIVAPMIFGLAMDHGAPQWVFLMTAVFSLLAIFTVTGARKPRP
jgi:FSR family fosmidomycin resistance protein-like MFS transporter